MGGALYTARLRAVDEPKSARPGAEQRTSDEQNEASFSSPSAPRV